MEGLVYSVAIILTELGDRETDFSGCRLVPLETLPSVSFQMDE